MENSQLKDLQEEVNNIESKERKQTNQEIASQLQFIVFLGSVVILGD